MVLRIRRFCDGGVRGIGDGGDEGGGGGEGRPNGIYPEPFSCDFRRYNVKNQKKTLEKNN
jgi:hypothetical protein